MSSFSNQRVPNGLLSKKEVAEMLGLTIRRIDHMVFVREIPFIKIGRSVRFDASEIASWLSNLPRNRVTQGGGR